MIGFSGSKKLITHFLDSPEVRRAKTTQHHLFDVTARKMKSIQFIWWVWCILCHLACGADFCPFLMDTGQECEYHFVHKVLFNKCTSLLLFHSFCSFSSSHILHFSSCIASKLPSFSCLRQDLIPGQKNWAFGYKKSSSLENENEYSAYTFSLVRTIFETRSTW